MPDQRTVMEYQRVHAAKGVFPVGIGELELAASEGVDDHSTSVFASVVVEVGGVNQAGSHYLHMHNPGSTSFRSPQEPLWKGLRGRDQCRRTVCPGRICAILSMSSSTTTPMTG